MKNSGIAFWVLALAMPVLSSSFYDPERVGTQAPDDPVLQKKIAGLIQDWESAKHEVREQASKALQGIGEPARRQLEAAAKNSVLEVRTRAQALMKYLDEKLHVLNYDIKEILLRPDDASTYVPTGVQEIVQSLVGNVFSLDSDGNQYPFTANFVVSLIRGAVGRGAEDWGAGTSAEVKNGILWVSQSKRMHREIEQFLGVLRPVALRQVRLDFEWIRLTPEVYREVIAPGAILDDRRLARLKKAIEGSTARMIATQVVTSRHGQQQNFWLGKETDYKAAVTTGENGQMLPLIEKVRTGLSLRVRPVLFFDQVVLDVWIEITDPDLRMKHYEVTESRSAGHASVDRGTYIDLPRSYTERMGSVCRLPIDHGVAIGTFFGRMLREEGPEEISVLLVKASVTPNSSASSVMYLTRGEPGLPMRIIDTMGLCLIRNDYVGDFPYSDFGSGLAEPPVPGAVILDTASIQESVSKLDPKRSEGGEGFVEMNQYLLVCRADEETMDRIESYLKKLFQGDRQVRTDVRLVAISDNGYKDWYNRLSDSHGTDRDWNDFFGAVESGKEATLLAQSGGVGWVGSAHRMETRVMRNILNGTEMTTPVIPVQKTKGFVVQVRSYVGGDSNLVMNLRCEYSDFQEPVGGPEKDFPGITSPEVSVFSYALRAASVRNGRWTVAAAGTGKFVEGKPHVLMLVKAEVID